MSHTAPRSPSVADLVAAFLAAKRRKRCTPRTLQTYAERLAPFLVWLGDRPVTREVLQGYLDHLLDQPISQTTAAGRFRVVTTFCSWLVEEGYLAHNPAHRLTPRAPAFVPPSYSREQLTAILAACNVRDRALVLVLLDTGLRAGELLSLERASIAPSGQFRVMGKGQKQRTITLGAGAHAALRAYLETRQDRHPALWMGRTRPLTYTGLYQTLKRRTRQAGIRGELRRLIHGLRVTFVCMYLEEGGNIETARRILGHATRAMTEHYAQHALDRLAQEEKLAVDHLAAIIGEAQQAQVSSSAYRASGIRRKR